MERVKKENLLIMKRGKNQRGSARDGRAREREEVGGRSLRRVARVSTRRKQVLKIRWLATRGEVRRSSLARRGTARSGLAEIGIRQARRRPTRKARRWEL
ncbi:leucine-rich repeat extensin-like protein 3 [Iris pallida]|uniref:Leucine-rich repeat extensin-like protein 3 n=1 Tax=Iris pallida TaxID=29817 RepID=A0AAX6I412_IRIPA|nr:leucine-rich repeat extensin-like protein 3 [Iris pallida]